EALSGRRFDDAGGTVPLDAGEWARVRSLVEDAALGEKLDVASWHRHEALQCVDAKDWSGAILHLDRLIAARPEECKAYYHRGRCRAALNNDQAALRDLTRAVELGADDSATWYRRGQVHWRLSMWKESAAAYEKVISIYPEIYQLFPWMTIARAQA